MATAREIAIALQDDAETRALMHGLNTYRSDAAMYARDICSTTLPACATQQGKVVGHHRSL